MRRQLPPFDQCHSFRVRLSLSMVCILRGCSRAQAQLQETVGDQQAEIQELEKQSEKQLVNL